MEQAQPRDPSGKRKKAKKEGQEEQPALPNNQSQHQEDMETGMLSDLTSAQNTAQHDINKQLQEAIMRISESVEAIRKANQEDKQNQAARFCTLEANINEALLTHRSTRRATPYAKTNSDVWTPNPTSSQDGPPQ